MRFWCQHPSIFPFKIHQNPSKNRSQDASNFWSIFASIFSPFWLHLGTQVGAMLATFSSKMGRRGGAPPPFLLGLCYFSIFWSSWPPLGPIWARFWRVWASILEVFGVHFGGFWSRFGCHVACNFGTFLSCSFLKLPLVRGGLVGLREAQRISDECKYKQFCCKRFLVKRIPPKVGMGGSSEQNQYRSWG